MLRNTFAKRKWLLFGGGGALVLLSMVIGAFFVVPMVAAAQAPTPAATNNTTNYCEQYTQDLAKQLNISVDTLNQARTGAKEDVLAQLVKDGKLTQAQADAIKQRLTTNQGKQTCERFAYKGQVEHTLVQKYGPDVLNAVAQKLNLTADQLKAQLQSGKTLAQIAKAQGVAMADVRTTLTTAIDNAVDKAVSAGDLTQSQGTAIKQALQKHPNLLDRLLTREWKGKTAK
jgi:polyhydroxyalkanoate synthesis regulator phasin